uniref:NLPC_P60 domain-containing protein n=1 Tax=Steinernema glaseri TaxID=37863 RepID=A0A1I7YAE9_9BILA
MMLKYEADNASVHAKQQEHWTHAQGLKTAVRRTLQQYDSIAKYAPTMLYGAIIIRYTAKHSTHSNVRQSCATTGTQQSSQDKDRAELDHGYYADYEFQTESDPLGTYLANRARNDINIAYSSDRRQGRTESRSKQNSSSTHGLANAALNFLGVKYSFGGDAPSTGFDCSGLVSYVAEKSLGLKLPRQSKDIAKEGTSVNRSELRKGDLVFFNTRGARFSH